MAEYTEKRRNFYQELFNVLAAWMKYFPHKFERKLEKALAHGFPIDFQNGDNWMYGDGWTLLKIACYDKNDTAIDLLLSHGSDPNAIDRKGNSVLNLVLFETYSLELAEYFIQLGANVDAKNRQGQTAFNRAATRYIYNNNEKIRKCMYTIMKFLLEHSANPCLCNWWTKLRKDDTEEHVIRRVTLYELCDSYLTKLKQTNNS